MQFAVGIREAVYSQAAQAPAVRWSSCALTVMTNDKSLYGNIYDRSKEWKNTSNSQLKYLTLLPQKSFSYLSYIGRKPRNGKLAKMGSFLQSKWSDSKWYAVEVRCFFLSLRAVVIIPIQTLMIPPWLLLCKMIISQFELGPPVVHLTNVLF